MNEGENFKPTPLNDNDPEFEAAYLNSYPVEAKDIPKGAKLIGVIEALAFPVENYQDTDGNYISCVQERRGNEQRRSGSITDRGRI